MKAYFIDAIDQKRNKRMRAVLFLRIPLPESRDRGRRKDRRIVQRQTERKDETNVDLCSRRARARARARAYSYGIGTQTRSAVFVFSYSRRKYPSLPRSLFRGEINV